MNEFVFSTNGNWGNYLYLESDRLNESLEFIVENKIKNIVLNSHHGFQHKDITCLNKIALYIEGLDIVDSDIDIFGIESFKNLKNLYIADKIQSTINFAAFKNLERCNIVWNKKYSNILSCTQLKELVLRNYNDNPSSFFKAFRKLESLSFIQTNITDLNFLIDIPELNSFELFYAPKVVNINGLKYCSKTLNLLELDHCKKIDNYNVLYHLNSLKKLIISDSKEIGSIDFITCMSQLEHFSFVGTNIINGDLSYCIGLKHVGFNNKKHYSHTYEEVKYINNIKDVSDLK